MKIAGRSHYGNNFSLSLHLSLLRRFVFFQLQNFVFSTGSLSLSLSLTFESYLSLLCHVISLYLEDFFSCLFVFSFFAVETLELGKKYEESFYFRNNGFLLECLKNCLFSNQQLTFLLDSYVIFVILYEPIFKYFIKLSIF